MKKYINLITRQGLETIDEFEYDTKEQKSEAKRCLREYQISDTQGYYRLSQRACKHWDSDKRANN